MVKVLSIASYPFLPPKTGGQKCIAFFNRFFTKHISFVCVSVPENAVNNTDDYDIVPLLKGGLLRYINPLLFFIIRRYIKQNGITHVLLEHPYYGWLGALLKWFTGIKLVVHAHNIEALRFRDIGKWWWRILWYYERATLRTADTCFFISEEDRQYAIQYYGVDADKSIVVTYGISANNSPSRNEKRRAKEVVAATHSFDQNDLLILYSAALNYAPNLKALNEILDNINPLLQKERLRYKIVITGNNLPEQYNNLVQYKKDNIIFAGFVEDINLYFTAADIFLNPISEGGGIKTKLVEALAANASSVSYRSGAFGVPRSVTGNKLQIVSDNDALSFFHSVLQSVQHIEDEIPESFFNHFYWNNIAQEAAEKLQVE